MNHIIGKSLTNVILPNMHTLASHGLCNIYAVVDEERYIEPLRDVMKLPGCGYQNPSVAGLVPILDACYAAFECGLDDLTNVVVTEYGGCRVRHQV